MKIRTGFVSNSSSSSFMIGIAEIVDKTKFAEFVGTNSPELKWPSDLKLFKVDGGDTPWELGEDYESYYVEAIYNRVSLDKKTLLPNAEIVLFYFSGGEPEDDGSGEYYADETWFGGFEVIIFNAFLKNGGADIGLASASTLVGAGYDG